MFDVLLPVQQVALVADHADGTKLSNTDAESSRSRGF